ncbi:MAG: hypothetical protein ACO1N4_03140 [Pedobacter sp.]
MLIYKTKRNGFRQVLLTYVPDYDYLQKSNFSISGNQINKIAANFSGYILYSSLKTGRNIQLLQFENGKMIKKRYVNTNGKAKGKQVQKVKGGTQTMGWEEQCIDIYETPCITAGDPGVEVCQDPIKVGEECQDVWVDDPEEPGDPEPGDPCDDPANFWMCNPDNPDPEDPWEPEPEQPEDARDSLDKIMKDTCLNAQQVEALAETLSGYLNGQGDADLACIQKAIYNKVLAAGKKFGFCVDSNISGNGSYNPATGNFLWKDESGIPVVGLFGREFFHGYQDTHYSGGTAQYNTGMQNGFPNIEFEQALFNDILNGSATAMGSGVPSAIFNEYEAWIESITDNYTKYPKQFSDFGTDSNNVNKYYHFLSLFYQHSAYANMGTVNNSLQPSALLNIFNTSNCK